MTHHWQLFRRDGSYAGYRCSKSADLAEEEDLTGIEAVEVARAPDPDQAPDGKGGWQLDYAKIRAPRLAVAQKERDRRLDAPVPTTMGPVDRVGRGLLERQVRVGKTAEFRFADGTMRTLNPGQRNDLQGQIDRHMIAIHAAFWAIEKKINAASTRPAIAAVDIEAGYPGD